MNLKISYIKKGTELSPSLKKKKKKTCKTCFCKIITFWSQFSTPKGKAWL